MDPPRLTFVEGPNLHMLVLSACFWESEDDIYHNRPGGFQKTQTSGPE
jgi:hypothetical protein